ncbi:MAG: hypothetical protein OXR82_08800, partial [Gammaproteobacteria bacterium]|nr:hypothetical protein [Gammaproteobacteria bacterium]
ANWPAERRYFDRSTPLPYRGVGAALNVSPLHVQTIVRGWTGHLGNAAVVALDEAMWNERTNGPKPSQDRSASYGGVELAASPAAHLHPVRQRVLCHFRLGGGVARSGTCSGLGNATRVSAVCRARTLGGRTARDASELRRQGDDVRTARSKSRRTKERELEALYAEIDGMFRLALPELRDLRGRGFDVVGAPAPATRSTGAGRTRWEPRQRTRPTRRRR